MGYVYRRILFYIVALWASITLNFAIPRLMPGNPAEVIFAQHAQQFQSDPYALQTIQASLGLSNDPLPLQYWHYMVDLAHGDLGISFTQFPVRVSTIIGEHLPWTLLLVGTAAIIAFMLGTILGMIAAWRRGGVLDSALTPLTLLLSSFPVFFLALLLLYFLGSQLSWFPIAHNFTEGTQIHLSPGFVGDVMYHAILPALAIVLTSIGGWLLGMRNAMINTLAEDYITMASAKGLSDRRIMIFYAARNALLPQITGFALALGFILGGTFLVETIFSYEGIGFYLVYAVNNEDYPLLQGLLLVVSVGVLLANLMADLLYARLDPRVRRA